MNFQQRERERERDRERRDKSRPHTCTRCTPASYLSLLYTFSPLTSAMTVRYPPASTDAVSIILRFHP